MADDLVVRLHGGRDREGEIDAAGLAALVGSLQLLTTRLARHLVDQSRPGRAAGVVERAARLRLVGFGDDGTVLRFALGEDDVLVDGLEHEVTDALFELVRGLWNEAPPPWTTPLLGDACVGLLDALARTSRACTVGGSRFREASFRPEGLSRAVWPRSAPRPDARRDQGAEPEADPVDTAAPPGQIVLGNLDDDGNRSGAGALQGGETPTSEEERP